MFEDDACRRLILGVAEVVTGGGGGIGGAGIVGGTGLVESFVSCGGVGTIGAGGVGTVGGGGVGTVDSGGAVGSFVSCGGGCEKVSAAKKLTDRTMAFQSAL